MKLLVIRHGQTIWNAKNVVQGMKDIPLSDHGKNQAEQAMIKLKDIVVDEMYCSPLMRAKETAEILNQELHLDIQINPLLSSMNLGKMEGQVKSADIQSFLKEFWQFKKAMPGIESFGGLKERVEGFLEYLKSKHSDSDTIAIITHRPIIRMMYVLSGQSFDIIQPAKNCEVIEFVLEEKISYTK